jgi:coenzyme F420 hydrogenase subunit beta
MKHPRSIREVLDGHLCVGCGACEGVTGEPRLQILEDSARGHSVPSGASSVLNEPGSVEFTVCPGPGFPLDAMSRGSFGDMPTSLELGRYHLSVAARATDGRVTERASSGGVMTAIGAYLLTTSTVDAVIATGYRYDPIGPRPVSLPMCSLEDLLGAQGSKYCPTSPNQLIARCRSAETPHLFIGTPCQVASLRVSIAQDPRLSDVFPLTMANFCGGLRSTHFMDALLRRYSIPASQVHSFQFRDSRTGGLRIEDKAGHVVSQSYPEYARGIRVAKLKRCLLCIDATAQLADFACGDAWIPRYQNRPHAWSIVLARSERAVKVLMGMQQSGLLDIEPVSATEVIESQRSNLTSKITRQRKRMKLLSLLGATLPRWDVELPDGSSYSAEARVLLSKYLSDRGYLRWMHRCGGQSGG